MAVVSMDLDQHWVFTPCKPAEQHGIVRTIEVPDELLAEFKEAADRWFPLQEKLEHFYRQQEGLKPYEGSPFKV